MEMKKSQIFEDSISDSSGDEIESVKFLKDSVNLIQNPQEIEKKQQIVYSIDDSSSSSDEEISRAKEIKSSPPIGPFSLILQSNDSLVDRLPLDNGPFGGEQREMNSSRLSTISDTSSTDLKLNCASPSSVESLHPDDHLQKDVCQEDFHPPSHLSSTPPQIQVDNEIFSQQSFESDSEETEIQLSNPLQQLLQVQASGTTTTKGVGVPAVIPREAQPLRVSPPASISPSDEKIFVRPIISTKPQSTIDSLTNWRKSLWPPLSPFYRILLRCKCISMDNTNSDHKKRGRSGNGKAPVPTSSLTPLTSSDISSVQFVGLEWTEFWDPNCLEFLPTIFEKYF
jgi:hypothetical protein